MAITEAIKETVDCEKIYLFGSYANGEPYEGSDFDFYVVLPDDSGQPLEALQKIYCSIGQMERMTPVDILANHASRFEARMDMPTMERQVVREGIVLYERGELSHHMA
ncbi:MAG: nucleotidyltransferase domain-containing protein [Oscillospiraceae bacterium]|nr:nucleotidyltransferase domain-containing protein [Oscillospiraceae bacterium]